MVIIARIHEIDWLFCAFVVKNKIAIFIAFAVQRFAIAYACNCDSLYGDAFFFIEPNRIFGEV